MFKKNIRLAIADDHILFTKFMVEYLSKFENIKIAIEANNTSELIKKLSTTETDVLLLDLFMQKTNSIDVISFIAKEFPNIKIIVLSMCRDLNIISSLLELGIHAYVSKNDDPQSLIQSIVSVTENKIYRNYLYVEALLSNIEKDIKLQIKNKCLLSDREKKIIQLLWEEKTNEEIAKSIYLSIRSVEKIRQDIKQKLGNKSIAGMFRYALYHGLISVENYYATMNI